MGKTCEPKAFSFQCMTEFTTNKKNKKTKKHGSLLKYKYSIQTMYINSTFSFQSVGYFETRRERSF